MQVTIARQLGLEPTTVGNFFMNARRRSHDKWKDINDHDLMCDPEPNNIKYEVYDCNDGLGGDQGGPGGGGGGYNESYDDQPGVMGPEPTYHNMTTIPAPVHNPHVNQIQHQFPSTCT